MYRELLLGCGAKRVKDRRLPRACDLSTRVTIADDGWQFVNLTTLDINRDHKPDIVQDLQWLDRHDILTENGNSTPENWYDEIHAYEILEHIGQQGDFYLFFAQFTEFHRIMKPGGFFFATCPSWCSPWAWGDPSHTRVITSGTLVFLSQAEYAKQVGVTPMSDFRYLYKADFETVFCEEDNESLRFVLRAIK